MLLGRRVEMGVLLAFLVGCNGNGSDERAPDTGGSDSAGAEACPSGTERCSCYGNHTCNEGLLCLSDLCVSPPDGGAAGATVNGEGGRDAGGELIARGGAPRGLAGGGGVSGYHTGGYHTGGYHTGGYHTGGYHTGGYHTGGYHTGGYHTGGARTGGTGGFLPTGGVHVDGGAGTGGTLDCLGERERARPSPLNLIFMIDKSGSMGAQDLNNDGLYDGANEWNNIYTRWEPVRSALTAFFENPGVEGLAASLEFFPNGGQPTSPNTGVCRAGEYEYPSVSLSSLDDPRGADALVAALNQIEPKGGTPTLPALQGAIAYAHTAMEENPGSRSAVVFVTDGMPGVGRALEDGTVVNEKCFCYGSDDCRDRDQSEEIMLAAEEARASAAAGIATYVIGMGEMDPSALDMIADAGGTGAAIIVSLGDSNTTRQMMGDALRATLASRGECKFELPRATSEDPLDVSLINLEWVRGSGASVPLAYTNACPAPDSIPSRLWTYDDAAAPKAIILCGDTCAEAQADATGDLFVDYGCATRVGP